jgi:hypothetical protein
LTLERVTDDFGHGHSLRLGTTSESFLELWVEAHRLDRRRSRAESWPTARAPSGDDLVGVVAGLGFVGQPVDELVVDDLALPDSV